MSKPPVSARAFAPASIGNVGVGFDLLGLAIAGVGDRVVAERSDAPGVRIAALTATPLARGAEALSTDPLANTAGIAAQALLDATGPGFGVTLSIEKGIPLGSGMGSSAASAVAAVVAANALLDAPLDPPALLPFALEGERFASGALHADNVAPCLLGGLVLCPARLGALTVRVPAPADVVSVLVHPALTVHTAASRRRLKPDVPLGLAVEQAGCLAAFLAACYRGDIELLRLSFDDVVIEPQRAAEVAGFDAVKSAALSHGALGCSLSGSGPSVFALARSADAEGVRDAMLAAFQREGSVAEGWISPLDAPGAGLVP